MYKLLEILKSRLNYDMKSGVFTYKHDYNVMKKGEIAGRFNTNGHIQISINNKRYMAHNLAWLYVTGEYPETFIIDHIDRNYSNNSFGNLRKANLSLNQGNSEIRKDNTSKIKGVSWSKNKKCWVAQICKNSKKIHIGYFSSKEDAKKAYEKAAIFYFGNFANVSK